MSCSLRNELCLGYFGLASALAMAALIPVHAEEKQKPEKEAGKVETKIQLNPAEKLQVALRKPISIEFHEVPLSKAVSFLGQNSGIRIDMDTPVFEKAELSPETPITCSLKNVPLQNALKLILLEIGAKADVRGDHVLITSPKPEDEELKEDEPKEKSPSRLAVEKALQRPVKVDFQSTPLIDIVQFFRDFTGVNIVIYHRALREARVDKNVSVTLQADGKPFGTVINEMLSPLDLEAVVRFDVLLITNKPKPAP